MTVVATAPPAASVWGGVAQFLQTWGRVILSVVALVAQLVAFVVFAVALLRATGMALGVAALVDLVVMVWLVNRRMPTAYKLAWAILILVVPVAGPLFFVFFGSLVLTPDRRRRLRATGEASEVALWAGRQELEADADLPDHVRRQLTFLARAGGRPPSTGDATYIPTGEEGFEELLTGIATAERSVLCQFFMLASGEMFERLFAALAERAAAGVDVRLLHDDLGSSLRRPRRLAERCAAAGIQMRAVNPLGFGLTLRHNHRDHRKLCVVDGRLAYTGGINIGDEYINVTSPFGYWKDCVLKVEGPAAWAGAVAFLRQWALSTRRSVEIEAFRPQPQPEASEHLAVAFDDTPFDPVGVALGAYRGAIAGAARTVDILTPYVAVEDFMTQTLFIAASSGVRVRIVCPGRSDGWAVGHVTRSYQKELIAAGVEVYEYQPGFLHTKLLLADDDIALLSSVNLDYRSFYLNFENGFWLHASPALSDMRADIDAILAVSRRITADDLAAVGLPTRLLRAVLRTFAPLM